MRVDKVLCCIPRSRCHHILGIISISKMGAVHCGIEKKLVWNLFERDWKVFFCFRWPCFCHSWHPSLPSLISYGVFFWDTLPTFSLNFTSDSVPSVVAPNILPSGITFLFYVQTINRSDQPLSDQTTMHTSCIAPPPLPCLHLTSWLNKIHRILRAIYIDIFIYVNQDVLLEIHNLFFILTKIYQQDRLDDLHCMPSSLLKEHF